MVMICGIDEAGRGPVIGPMVIAGVMIKEKDIPKLRNIGVKDSKLLSLSQRERMFEQIKKAVKDYRIFVVSPKQMVDALASPDLNLNKLEGLTSAKIANELNPDKVIIDCPSNNIPDFVKYVAGFLEVNAEIIAEHRADAKYEVASAASILAKVTRDREIEKLKQKYNIQIGSGYPSDPLTRKFVEENYNKYDFFRKSWSSYKKVAEKKTQSRLSGF